MDWYWTCQLELSLEKLYIYLLIRCLNIGHCELRGFLGARAPLGLARVKNNYRDEKASNSNTHTQTWFHLHPDSKKPILAIWYLLLDTWSLILVTWHLLPDACITWNLLLILFPYFPYLTLVYELWGNCYLILVTWYRMYDTFHKKTLIISF